MQRFLTIQLQVHRASHIDGESDQSSMVAAVRREDPCSILDTGMQHHSGILKPPRPEAFKLSCGA